MRKQIILTTLLGFIVFFLSGVVYADTAIHLTIKTESSTLYDSDITVSPCDSDKLGTMSATAYCAILQSGLANDWTWYGTDAFLNSISGTINNDGGNGVYWGWFNNLELGQNALNKYILASGDSILLNYGTNPLKIFVDNENPTVGDTIKFTVTEFGYDSSWNPVWNPAASGKIVIGSNIFDLDESGTYSLKITDEGTFIAKGQKTNFIDSPEITITPKPKPHVASGGGSASVINFIKPNFDLEKAFQYLASQQKEDGSFGDSLYTNWTALALASNPHQQEVNQKLIKYFEEFKTENPTLTDNERHAMALLALGLNPYNVGGKNYIEKIVGQFDGKQFGDANEDNDDIFALIVLQNAGYKKDEEIIKNSISFVLNRQKEDGSWDASVDMTGASMEALSVSRDDKLVGDALVRAKNFLEKNQKDNRGWSNASSTAWAIEGMTALGEKQEDWEKNENTPADYLATVQDTDGGIQDENVQNEIWKTAYVTSALSGKSWNQVMQKVEKPVTQTEKPNSVTQKTDQIIIKKYTPQIPAINTIIETPSSSVVEKTEIPRKNWFVRFWENIFNLF